MYISFQSATVINATKTEKNCIARRDMAAISIVVIFSIVIIKLLLVLLFSRIVKDRAKISRLKWLYFSPCQLSETFLQNHKDRQ